MVLECCFGMMFGGGVTIEDFYSSLVLYSMRKGGMDGGEYGYSTWCYSLECYIHLNGS